MDEFKKYEYVKSNLILGEFNSEVPEYSFLIPTYCRPQLVKRAILSLENQKTDLGYEILVVDNEPEKNTETEQIIGELARQYSNILYYKNEENIGLFGNWNRCYILARTKWCCICMSDDELVPEYLQRVDAVRKKYHLDCVRVGAKILDVNEESIIEKSYFDRKYHNRPGHVEFINGKYFLYRGALPPSGMCVLREAILELGGYRERWWPGADFEFDTRLVYKYKVGLLWERLCVTHTEDSTSMKQETIRKSVSVGNQIMKKTYKMYYADEKYKDIADIRSFIALDKLNIGRQSIPELDVEDIHNSRAKKKLFKIKFWLFRIWETIDK